MLRRLREPANGLTHLIGAILSLVGLPVLIYRGIASGQTRVVVAFIVFGLSQIALYTASALYHSVRQSPQGIDRLLRFDCAMVFVLIAGTYTPICLIALHDGWRWSMLAVIWALAVSGIVAKLYWMDAPIWLSTSAYVLMGWVAVVALPALTRALPPDGIVWLFAGGIVYTVGAIVFALDRPSLIPGIFDAHALWHLFVLGGSFCFFWVIIQYVAPLG